MKDIKFLLRFEANLKCPLMLASELKSYNEVVNQAKENLHLLGFDKVEIWNADYLTLVTTIVKKA